MNISKTGIFSPKNNLINFNALPMKTSYFRTRKEEISQKDKFELSKPYIIDNYETLILNTQSGYMTPCQFVTIPADEHDYRRIAVADNKIVGMAEMRLSKYPGGKAKKADSDDILYNDFHQLVCIATAPGYKGVGKDLIKGAIIDSFEAHQGGTLLLKAKPSLLPKVYKNLSADKLMKCPVPYYFKLGFRFLSSEDNEKAERGIKVMEKTGEYPKSAPQKGAMYLDQKSAWRLLEN